MLKILLAIVVIAGGILLWNFFGLWGVGGLVGWTIAGWLLLSILISSHMFGTAVHCTAEEEEDGQREISTWTSKWAESNIFYVLMGPAVWLMIAHDKDCERFERSVRGQIENLHRKMYNPH